FPCATYPCHPRTRSFPCGREFLAPGPAVVLDDLIFTVERLIRDAKQRAKGHAKAESVGGDRRRVHIERNCARLRSAADDGGISDLPVEVVHACDGSSSH